MLCLLILYYQMHLFKYLTFLYVIVGIAWYTGVCSLCNLASDLEVSLKKTEVLYQPVPKETYCLPHITVGETELKAVQQFTYLGCTITSDTKINKEVDNRLAKANSAFGRLYSHVWSNKHLKIATTISIYRAVVLPTLLYGSETWVTYSHHLRLLERFHQRCLRSIFNIHWSNYVTNVEVLQQAGITSIEAMMLKTQLRRAGHGSRMEVHHLTKIVLYGELSTGHHDRGAPKTSLRNPCQPVTSIIISGQPLPLIKKPGDTPFTNQSSLMRTTAELPLKRSAVEGRTASSQHQPQTRHTPAAAVAERLSCIGLVSHQRTYARRGKRP